MEDRKEYKVISHAFADGKGNIFYTGKTIMLTEEEATPFIGIDLELVTEAPDTATQEPNKTDG